MCADTAGATQGLRDAVAGIWCAVLGVADVGSESDFFAEGGDSALAVETAFGLRALTGTEFDLDVLYRYPRFGQLLAALARPVAEEVEQRPLTAAEERLWFAERLHPGSPQHHIPALYRFADGVFDVLRLRTALDALVLRHKALRCGFEAPGRAVTVPRAEVSCRWADARGLPESAVREIVEAHARRPFDLARPPLLRALAVDCGAEGDVLLLTVHHLACDEDSLALLEDELGRLYTDGAAAPRPGPQPQTLAQPAALPKFDLEQSRSYWRRTLDGCPRGITLPQDRLRPETPGIAGGVHELACAGEMLADMAALAAQEQLSALMVWVLAYAVGLVSLTGEREVVIGIAASTRTAEQGGEIGSFANPLPLRLTVPAGSTARDLARQVRRVTAEALVHRAVPFQTIVEDLGPGGDPSRPPLVQAGLACPDASGRALRFDGFEARRELLHTSTSAYELRWSVSAQPRGTTTELTYLSDLFSPHGAAQAHAALLSAARAAFARPDAALGAPPRPPP